MKKIIILSLLLSGCGASQSTGTIHSGTAKWEKICIGGVEYLTRTLAYQGFMAPHLKPDSTVHTCDNR